jgi:hypothetical protein
VARSAAASVCPARRRTPPCFARQREDVAGLDEIVRRGGGIGQDADGGGAVRGADAGGDAARGIDGDGEIGALALAIVGDHALEAELLGALRW